MSTTAPPVAPARPSFLRAKFPLIAFAVGAVGVAVAWLWPDEDLMRVIRVMCTVIAVGLPCVLSLLWLLFFAPYPRAARYKVFGVIALLVAAFVVSVRWSTLRFSGDLVPSWYWLWQRTPDEIAAEHREKSARAVPLTEAAVRPGPHDWPEYRGPKRDGVVVGPALARDWDAQPPTKIWRQPVGEGLSSFAVVGDLAVTLEQHGDDEAVVGYELSSGKIAWIHAYAASFSEKLGGPGPRSTPTIHNGEVFSLGATGQLVCLEARTGGKKWSADVTGQNRLVTWAASGSPLVVDDLVVVNPGIYGPEGTAVLVAHDRKTGARRWGSGSGHSGYSSPMLAELSGGRQILLLDGEGFSGYDPKDGKQLWRHVWDRTQENINVAQPLLLSGDRVLISSGYGIGSAALEVKKSGTTWAVKELWKSRKLACKFTSPVLHEGHIYGLSEGRLVCLEAGKGAVKWRGNDYGHGQVLLTGGLLLIQEDEGKLALVEATPQEFRELARFQAIEERTWNLPVLTGGRALVRNHREMALYDLRAKR